MNILFLHNKFPAQFMHVANALASQAENTVVFLSQFSRHDLPIPRVRHIQVPKTKPHAQKNKTENVVVDLLHTGELYANAMLKLKKEGFRPDIIYDHPGWGCSAYVPDIFPSVPRLCFFEWFYTKNADFAFFTRGRNRPPTDFAENRQRNFYQLDALRECQVGIVPTWWQALQYPQEFAYKFRVLHDGIDTQFFSPASEKNRVFGEHDLSHVHEIVTYATRGLEPYRGFPQFYRSLPTMLKARPQCHVAIMGNDSVSYGGQRRDGKTWGKALREEVLLSPAESARVHFLPYGSYEDYRRLLRISTVHIYLTIPFVLSWSLLEAMSCGCCILASDTEPVREVIRDGQNGTLTSFWEHDALAARTIHLLENAASKTTQSLRAAARATIVERYNLASLLPQHLTLLRAAAGC